MSQLRIRVLGPVTAEFDGAPLQLSKPRQRELLGILVAARGGTVSPGRLVDELWEDAPAGAVGAVQTFVGELRRIIEPGRRPRTPPAVLVTTAGGYALRTPPAGVDLWRAERDIKSAAGLRAADREPLLADALEEWRGPAFEEFSTRSWARDERARIAELRAGAAESLAETRLALGRPEDVPALLNAHIAEHPWREEGWRLLALALYRSARQGDALKVLAQARSTLRENLGLEPGSPLAELERDILRRSPSLELPDGGGSILLRAATATAHTGPRSQLESATVLLPRLAVSGAVEFAGEQRLAAIAAAEEFGDPDLAARVIGGFDVPGSWTRSDDPAQSAAIVAAALRTLAALPPDTSPRVRARLLATVAMESRGTAGRLAEAAEAETIARRLDDPALLCLALSARYLQTFGTAGLARSREALGAEIIALAVAAELPTFEIEGRLVRMQALCALGEIGAAAVEASAIDTLAARFDRGLACVFTASFRWTFLDGPAPPGGREMPGFRTGLAGLAALTAAVRAGTALPDGNFGPYELWVRPLLLARNCHLKEAAAALEAVPNPPQDLMLEVSWFLVGLAAIDTAHVASARRAHCALLPAAAERAAGSAAVDLGPIAPLLAELSELCGREGRM
jgi:DNA-binding SARP family transcriptional activator